jgi:hypothetical protein
LGALYWVQDGRRAGAWACVVFVTVGQLIQERAIFYPFVVLGVLLLLDPNKGMLQRARSVLRRWWPMLLGLAATTTAFLVAHLLLARPTERQSYNAEGLLQLAGNYVGRTLLPGLAGGPWSLTVIYGGILVPAEISVVAVAILVAILMVWTLWRGRGLAAGAWLMFWCYVVLNLAAVMVGRPQFGTLIGLLPRYAADVVPVAAVSLAFVIRSVRAVPDPGAGPAGQRDVITRARLRYASGGWPWKGRWRTGLPWLATIALIMSCALTTTAIAPQGYNRDDEHYVATLLAGLHSDPEVVLYDSQVPDNVMISWFGDRRVTSTVLAGTDEHAVFDVPSENMRMVNDKGRLVDISLSYPTRARRGPVKRCGYAVGRRTTIPLPKRVRVRRAVMQLVYYADRQNVMTLGTGGKRQLVPIRRGAHGVNVVVSGSFDEVVLSQQDLGTVCVTALTVGSPTPGL